MQRRTARHDLVFSAPSFNPCPVTVIGAGAGGSIAICNLAKLGIENITICDPDYVAIENVGPSMYGPDHVGRPKVFACADIVYKLSGYRPKPLMCRAEELGPLEGVVFICVDSMAERKRILFEQCVYPPGEERVARVFEGRMSAHFALSHSFDPNLDHERETWMHYWFPDEEALEALPGCGATRVSVGATASMAAALMTRQFMEWWAFVQEEIPRASNQVQMDLEAWEGAPQYWQPLAA